MRRFSQRNSLVTLSDINITPLLDLAFVLLIIFVITTPLLEKGLDLQLPRGIGQPDKPLVKKNIRTVEVTLAGGYVYDHRTMKLEQLTQTLEAESRSNPNLLVFIRADENAKYKLVAEIIDRCRELGIGISLRADSRSQP
jgi:biopolymer transport protein ExbD